MKHVRVIKFVVCSLFCFALLALSARAQVLTGGTISGTVKDKTGAVIPSVTVTATNEATNVANTVQTNDAGAYSFLSLPIGKYDLDVKQTGFTDYKQLGITLDVNDHLVVDIALEVGAVSQTVEVSANAAHVETSSAALGNVIGNQTIVDQPLLDRSYIDLMGLQAGVNVSTGTGSVSGQLSAGNVSVSGSRTDANGFTVNGGNVEEGEGNGTAIIPDADSIAEFKIITNSAAAEYGHYSGGQVSVITKSGTNAFHGDGFEFFRNQDMNAVGYFKSPNPTYSQNQFGGTFGGPIKKNRLFFFGDYQGTRFSESDLDQVNVPTSGTAATQASNGPIYATSDELAGNLLDRTDAAAYNSPYDDFYGSVSSTPWANTLQTRLASATGQTIVQGEPYYFDGCTSTSPTTGCVFPGAIIPKAAWDPVSTILLNKFVAPLTPTAGVQINNLPTYQNNSAKSITRDDKGSGRIDATSGIGQLSFYYFFDNSLVQNPYAGGDIPGFSGETPARAQQVNFGDTKTFGGNQLNDLRINFTRTHHISNEATGGVTGSSFNFSTLGFATGANNGIVPADPAYAGIPEFDTNEFSGGISNSQVHQSDNTWQISDAYSIIHGNHQFKFGGEGNYVQVIERNIYAPNGEFDFTLSPSTETGDDYADFLLGAVDEFTQASLQFLDSRAWYYGLFAQDTWRIKPSFTLNYGLRQDVSTFWYDTQNKIQAIVPGLESQVYPGSPTGWVFPGDPGVPRTLAPTHYNNFAPRVAIAYSPNYTTGPMGKLFGPSGHTAIRAAWGIFYTVVDDGTLFDEIADAPFGLFWQQPAVLMSSPWTAMNGTNFGQHFPFTPPPAGDANINWSFYEPITSAPGVAIGDRLPYTEEYNFTIERQLSSATVLTVGYVGSQGHRLAGSLDANPGIPALCQLLSNTANLGPTATGPCGPGNEDTAFPLSAALGGGTVYGTEAPLGYNFGEGTDLWTTLGRSTYNSLQATLRHTGARYTFLVSYAWEKSMDLGSSNGAGMDPLPNPFPTLLNPTSSNPSGIPTPLFSQEPPTVIATGKPDLGFFRGLSSFDTPQNFVASYSYTLPFDKLTSRFSRLTHDWRVTATTRFASGTPVGLSYSTDNSLTNSGLDVPNFNGGDVNAHLNPRIDTATDPRFWIPCAKKEASTTSAGCTSYLYSNEPMGQFGNAMKYFIIGPGINNTDLSLQKNIAITGERQVQFRMEAFNVFNHTQFSSPSGTESSGRFMTITSTRAARVAQVGVKYLF